MIDERKGLSADCKLPPEIALALALSPNEHPCDRCNEDRKICRGYPRRDPNRKRLKRLFVSIEPQFFSGGTGEVFRVEVVTNEERYSHQEVIVDDVFVSMFEQMWKSVGEKIKHFYINRRSK